MNSICIMLIAQVTLVSGLLGMDGLHFINNAEDTGMKYTSEEGDSYYGLYGHTNNSVEIAMV